MVNSVPAIWVLARQVADGDLQRLGDARRAAERLGCRVGVLGAGPLTQDDIASLAAHGADVVAPAGETGSAGRVAAAIAAMSDQQPLLVIAPGDADGRAWAAQLAARQHWKLISPALLVQVRDGTMQVTGLDGDGRLSRRTTPACGQTAVITLRDGVAEAIPARTGRTCEIIDLPLAPTSETVRRLRHIPADPATVDIRHASRLIAGGRGLGGKAGFDLLRRVARPLGAGVAASRMAVDLGWIEHERQVGQTGKTVKPDLYIACGISGASHHLEGMSDARHIVVINSDPQAPIFKIAHLGLVADLHETLRHVEDALK